MDKKAFTMAEVLITILIIGVVGAMTIPTLIGGTSDRELVAGVRKANTTLLSAIKAAEAKHGQARFWGSSDDDSVKIFKQIIVENLSLNKVCYQDGGCLGSVKYKLNEAAMDQHMSDKGYGGPYTTAIASDGTNWIFDVAGDSGYYRFFIDVNGHKKGPNERCIDLHHWKWTLSTNEIQPDACTRDIIIDGEIVY